MENLCPRWRRGSARRQPSLQIQSRVSYSLQFGTPESCYKVLMGDDPRRAGGRLRGEGGSEGEGGEVRQMC